MENSIKQESQFKCPRCNYKMEEFSLGIRCSNKKCTFWIPREIRQKVLTKKIITELLKNKETGVIHGFHKRGNSQTFSARLILSEGFKIKICVNGVSDIFCPKCQMSLHAFERGYKCLNNEMCNFILWDQFAGKKLTPNQMRKLLKEGKTEIINGFLSKGKGKPYSARIIMSEYGDLRLEFIDKNNTKNHEN